MQKWIKKNAPLLLTCLGCAGVIGTGLTAIKAGFQTKEIIENPEYSRKEKFEKSFKYYIPPVLIGSSTIACILSAHVLNMRTQATLASAYALVNESYAEYRQAAYEYFGQEAEQIDIVVDGGLVETFDKLNPDNIVVVDNFLKIPFEISKEDLLIAENEVNRTFALRGYVSMYDFLTFAGVVDDYRIRDEVDALLLAKKFGWSIDVGAEMGYQYIDFYHQRCTDDNGNKYYILKYAFPCEPVLNYMYGWGE